MIDMKKEVAKVVRDLTTVGVHPKSEVRNAINGLLAKRDEQIAQRIGMLRQWLNEDRICIGNPCQGGQDRLVTNEQIKHWLGE